MPARPSLPQGSEPQAVTLAVRVQPRAARNEAIALPDGSLKVRLTAPPVNGAANEALVRFLANALSVGRSQIEVLSGRTGRQKVLRITGISADDVEGLLNAAAK